MEETSMIAIGPAPRQTSSNTKPWDDKFRTQVLKIFISHGDKIHGIQCQYVEDEVVVLGDIHGDFTGPRFSVVNLNYPLEYITGIKGSTRSDPTRSLYSLDIQTNLCLHSPMSTFMKGYTLSPFCFDLGGERSHFGGFHGTLDHLNNLTGLGIYLKPVTELVPPGNKDNNKDSIPINTVKVED